jgi:hypothetical protein
MRRQRGKIGTSFARARSALAASSICAVVVAGVACGDGTHGAGESEESAGSTTPLPDGAAGTVSGSSTGGATGATGDTGATGANGGAGDTGGASGSGGSGTSTGDAAAWILAELAGVPVVTGDFTTRQIVETPVLVQDSTACCSKYAFDFRETEAPSDPRVGFVNVTIHDLQSTDAWGGGFVTDKAAGAIVFLANVHIEPNWPTWDSYSTTNKDGMVLDSASAIYGADVTIENWNADGAIDNKADVSQFVRLTIEGEGNRGIRYWGSGPHYLVESTLENEGGLGEGSVLWFKDCSTVTVRVFDSTFNGSSTVAPSLVSCDIGSNPNIEYLTTDPRTTGEMHDMFSP